MGQTTIFDIMYPKYKITKPIRLIELFGGYGSQALALKYLGANFEHWKLCEWAVKSIQAYKDIHFNNFKYWNNLNEETTSKEKLVDLLYDLGISQNYNEPMSKEQIKRLSYNQLSKIYENIMITHDLVNIQQIKGIDLEIEDTDKYEYMLCYSFPCQDLSLAGKGKGMSDTSTRSGMLWEVEKILTECKELGSMPQVLLMENVPQVHSLENMSDFHKWQVRLEELGYKNYWQDLIATDFGIPQTRNRCFMVSILGDYSYTFPQPKPLKLKLKDMLEDNVDGKYYLSDKQIKNIVPYDTYYTWNDLQGNINTQCCRAADENRNALTIACANTGNVLIKNATAKGYLEATEGDGIDISSRMEHHRGTVQKGKTQTLTTSGGENNGVVVNDLKIRKLTPRECFRLMGVKDEDFDKVSKNQSDASLYHLAGDSIVVNVLMAIFKELL